MIKTNHFLMIIFLVGLYPQIYALRLSQFNYSSASVLPSYFIQIKQKPSVRPDYCFRKYKNVVMLHRTGENPHIRVFEDFSARRDKKEGHPVVTAARAICRKELFGNMVDFTLNQKILNYIDLGSHRNIVNSPTNWVVANTNKDGVGHVTYFTEFTSYWYEFIRNFYNLSQTSDKILPREIAIVGYDDLGEALANQKQDDAVYVLATTNPTTKKSKQEKILLSTDFVMRLRNFFCRHSCNDSRQGKIRFYVAEEYQQSHYEQTKAICDCAKKEPKYGTFFGTIPYNCTEGKSEPDLKKLALIAHRNYESCGSNFHNLIFNSVASIEYIRGRQYIKALELEQLELEDELNKLSFFRFFRRKKLRKKLKDNKKMLTILHHYRDINRKLDIEAGLLPNT